jgi:ribosome biogenesis SPOUT family RNA methylase Rps3
MVLFVIQHLEEKLTRWSWYEYLHAAEHVEPLLITGLKNPEERGYASRHLSAVEHDVWDLPFSRVVVLDPAAEEELKPEDFREPCAVVVGGILGDHPPRGRTRDLLTSKFTEPIARNIGEEQFPVDAAVFVAYIVSRGKELREIPVRVGVEVEVQKNHIVELPYAYPVVDGRAFISEKLLRYLTSDEIVRDEERALRTGHMPSVVE